MSPDVSRFSFSIHWEILSPFIAGLIEFEFSTPRKRVDETSSPGESAVEGGEPIDMAGPVGPHRNCRTGY